MKSIRVVSIAFIVIVQTVVAQHLFTRFKETPSNDWWKSASFYQIYPRSFQDSNGDGVGDLNGITARLPYLSDIGITATWLSPIFSSPMADFGYDISNFYTIQREYGTMDDFDRMIGTAKALGLKIILDFVPNHSSDENDWFRRSARREKYFKDFYVWHPGFVDAQNASVRRPPTNWISVFHGSAWTFNEVRQEFYLHQFSAKQPDLNYRNPLVVEEMKSVLRFWLNRGVSGFRIDAVPFLFEIAPDKDGNFPDEPRTGGGNNDPNDWNYLQHIYTTDQDETVDMVYQWRAELDKHQRENGGDMNVMLTECYSSLEMVMRYYGNATHEGAHLPFNFQFIERIRADSNAIVYKAVFDDWMEKMPLGRTPNWVMGNHDQNRVAYRLGEDRIDMINMLLLSLPGVSVTYNGEEIGMNDVWISWNDTVDPAACNTNPDVYEQFSRDPERTPFQWDASTSAGFSTNPKTWLPIAENYRQVNVDAELSAEWSHLKVYAQMMELRKEKTFRMGNVAVTTSDNNVLVILRYFPGEYSYVVLLNTGPSVESVDLTCVFNDDNHEVPDYLQYQLVDTKSLHKPGEKVSSKQIDMQPKESFVLVSPEPSPKI